MEKLQVATIACRDEAGLRFFFKKLVHYICDHMFQLSHSLLHLAWSIHHWFSIYIATKICSLWCFVSIYTYIPTLRKTSLLQSNEFFPIGFPSPLVYFKNNFFLYKHHTICNTKFAFGKTKSIHGCTWRVHKYIGPSHIQTNKHFYIYIQNDVTNNNNNK